jgi:hypothetical protein
MNRKWHKVTADPLGEMMVRASENLITTVLCKHG